jgi:hypothetical protein
MNCFFLNAPKFKVSIGHQKSDLIYFASIHYMTPHINARLTITNHFCIPQVTFPSHRCPIPKLVLQSCTKPSSINQCNPNFENIMCQ